MSKFWVWKDFKLILPGFLILRLYTGSDLVEIALKTKEEAGGRRELILSFGLDSFGEFIESLKKISSKVEKKDFGSKSLKYDFSFEARIEFNFYFNKDEFTKFYKFLENCNKEIIEQAREYRELTKGEIKQ